MALNDDFAADPKGFAEKYAFYPADEATGYAAVNETVPFVAGPYKGFRHTVVDRARGVARVDLATGLDRVRGEVVKVSPSLTATTGLPIYFLPWDHRGAAVELTIPNRDPGQPESVHPRFFFTAVLSGCSIMFKGSAQNPTIFHCGTGGTGHDELPTTGDSNAFWRTFVTQLNATGHGATGAVLSQLRSDRYMVPRGGSAAVDQLERDVTSAMQALYRKRIQMVASSAWGVAFGFRARGSRDWKFYMQLNVTIQYYDLVDVVQTMVKKSFLGLKKTVTTTTVRQQGTFHNVAKPIELQRIFPGAGTAKVTSTWRAIRGG